MKLVLDVENTVTEREGKLHLDPFESDNSLIMVGALTESGDEYLYRMDEDASYFNKIQELLDKTTVLIGHNIVHDLMWLWESNFKYDGDVCDTMLGEYVLQRGQKQALSLEMCAERYNLDTKKQDTLKEYFKQGIGVDEIPPEELSGYLSADLRATQELYNEITNKLSTQEYNGLVDTVNLTNRVALTLARIYQKGFYVDVHRLNEVRDEFTQEKKEIEEFLQKEVRDFMGDTPINLNSPEQLSWLIYSRKPKDKQKWCVTFSPHMPIQEYKSEVKTETKILYKTKAKKCSNCGGYGKVRKTRKDGTP